MKRTSISICVLAVVSFVAVIGCSTLNWPSADSSKAAVTKACQGKQVGDEVTIDGRPIKCWADKKIIKCSDADFRACTNFSNKKACENEGKSCCWWDLRFKKCEAEDKADIEARKTIQCIGGWESVCHNGNCVSGSKKCK